MRMVHLKVTSQSVEELKDRTKTTNGVWVIFITLYLISLTLDILVLTLKSYPIGLIWINRALSITASCFIIGNQWKYVIFFFGKKKSRMARESGKFSTEAKCLLAWLVLVLVINSINYIGYNALDIALNLQAFMDVDTDLLSRICQVIMMFWFDVLNLTNGLCFLFLFRSMAL